MLTFLWLFRHPFQRLIWTFLNLLKPCHFHFFWNLKLKLNTTFNSWAVNCFLTIRSHQIITFLEKPLIARQRRICSRQVESSWTICWRGHENKLVSSSSLSQNGKYMTLGHVYSMNWIDIGNYLEFCKLHWEKRCFVENLLAWIDFHMKIYIICEGRI